MILWQWNLEMAFTANSVKFLMGVVGCVNCVVLAEYVEIMSFGYCFFCRCSLRHRRSSRRLQPRMLELWYKMAPVAYCILISVNVSYKYIRLHLHSCFLAWFSGWIHFTYSALEPAQIRNQQDSSILQCA
jgi:hypothetical protein